MFNHMEFTNIRKFAIYVPLLFLTLTMLSSSNVARSESPTIFLPMISSEEVTDRAAPDSSANDCGLSPEAEQLMNLIQHHVTQQRDILVCDPTLTQVATGKAIDMAARRYFSHTTPEGIGPNQLAVDAGFPLPSLYQTRRDANYIESLAGGTADSLTTFNLLYDSESHRKHLMGESNFYRDQTHIGVGMVYDPNSVFRYYWVILISQKD